VILLSGICFNILLATLYRCRNWKWIDGAAYINPVIDWLIDWCDDQFADWLCISTKPLYAVSLTIHISMLFVARADNNYGIHAVHWLMSSLVTISKLLTRCHGLFSTFTMRYCILRVLEVSFDSAPVLLLSLLLYDNSSVIHRLVALRSFNQYLRNVTPRWNTGAVVSWHRPETVRPAHGIVPAAI